MAEKIAVLIVHGVVLKGGESQDMEKMQAGLQERYGRVRNRDDLVFEVIRYGSFFQENERELIRRCGGKSKMSYMPFRDVGIDFAGDAIAYQQVGQKSNEVYSEIHDEYQECLKRLAQEAGGDAPLCVICHSLGVIVSSNHFWDLGKERWCECEDSDLERGKTLSLFISMGSPLSLWSLRYRDLEADFNKVIAVPAVEMAERYPDMKPSDRANWINFYSRFDLISYPLKGINSAYGKVVDDFSERCGGWLFWTPLSHNGYWTHGPLLDHVTDRLVQVHDAVYQ